jgi:hypothetical protein
MKFLEIEDMEDSDGKFKALSVEFVPILNPFSCCYDSQSI